MIKNNLTVGDLFKKGRVTCIFNMDEKGDLEELDELAQPELADGILIKIKGTDRCVEVIGIIDELIDEDARTITHRPRLHFRNCVDP